MDPIARIRRMEGCFDALRTGDPAAPAAQSAYAALCRYMDSGDWLRDYERDEKGELPADLKRGVLSQDALYDLLTDIAEKMRCTPMKKIPVIIDCDPGVDDSYAIAMAHAHPEFEIVALTAVEGNVPAALTRRNCLCLREVLGMTDTKVAFGAELPLQKEYTRVVSVTHGGGGVGGIDFAEPERAPEDVPAWDLIYAEAVKHAGELILFAVGPLTNIAIALRKYPDLPKYIKRFVIMGGGTFGNVSATDSRAEFNIWIDPTAAKEVFEKMEVWMVGLNATHAAALTEQNFADMLAVTAGQPGRAADFLHKLSAFSLENSYGRGEDNNVIHDALAVAAVIDPDTVTFEKRYVYVEDGAVKNEGETVIAPAGTPNANCHVAMAVDQPRFVRMLIDTCRHYCKA